MPDERDEFYVGYLPTPPAHLQVVRVLVVLMAIWILGLAAVISYFMRDAGDSVWDTSKEHVWTGTLVIEPYPMLLPEDGSTAHLIVEMGKRGAHERVAAFARQQVSVRGFLLERDGRRIIELAPDTAAIESLGPAALHASEPEQSQGQSVVLRGEIVDGKCYLGAMKPGDGVTHKACATLCIRGGLPPMLVTETSGRPEFRLLIIDGQVALPEDLLPLIAERVRVAGELFEIAGLPAIRVSPDGIMLAP